MLGRCKDHPARRQSHDLSSVCLYQPTHLVIHSIIYLFNCISVLHDLTVDLKLQGSQLLFFVCFSPGLRGLGSRGLGPFMCEGSVASRGQLR